MRYPDKKRRRPAATGELLDALKEWLEVCFPVWGFGGGSQFPSQKAEK